MATTHSGRRIAAVVVVLVHGAAVVALQQLSPPGDRSLPGPVAERPPLIVRLMGPSSSKPAEPRRDAPPPARPRAPSPIGPAPAAAWIAPVTVPSTEPSGGATPALTETPSPAQAASEPPPLRLALPRAASAPPRRPALDDPRSRTPSPTLESRIAAATGVAAPTEELRGDGRARYRRGLQCVDVEPSRAGELDPFNAAVSPKPKAAKPC